MFASYLLISLLALYLLLVLLLFFFRTYRYRILVAFSLICWLGLLAMGAFTLFKPHQNPVKLEIINYSPRKGHLYFFQEDACNATLLFDFAVNANEESSLEIAGEQKDFARVIFLTEDGQLLKFPLEEAEAERIAIWEKELVPADSCFSAPIDSYSFLQLQYAVSTGLLIIGSTLMFGAAYRKKKNIDGHLK
jgi:hypothetical protein